MPKGHGHKPRTHQFPGPKPRKKGKKPVHHGFPPGWGALRSPTRPAASLTPPQVTYLPANLAFTPQSMDVYTGATNNPIPPTGAKRTTAAAMSITGTFMEGMRQKLATSFGYTHVILCDPNLEIRDGYPSNAGPEGVCDVLAIPTGVANYWVVIFSFVTEIPNLGRRKVILADRRTPIGDWTKIL
jgi:hypothetical protein